MNMDDTQKMPWAGLPHGASSNIQQEEEPCEEDSSRHLLWCRGGANGDDSVAPSLQINTREYLGRDL